MFPHFDALDMVFNVANIIEEGPPIFNGVDNELETLYDGVMKVEGMTDEERQQGFLNLIKNDELRVVFSHLPIDAKKEALIDLL